MKSSMYDTQTSILDGLKLTDNYVIGFFQILGGFFLLIVFGKALITSVIAPDHANHPSYTYFIAFLATLGSLWLLILGIKRIILRNKLSIYLQVIGDNSSTSILEIATFSAETPDVVRTNLNAMIKRNFFYHATINDTGTHLILESDSTESVTECKSDYDTNCELDYETDMELPTDAPSASSTATAVIVRCQNCGAVMTIPMGQIIECEYCGSPLKN